MSLRKHKSLIFHLGFAALGSTSIPITNYILEEREEAIARISENIRNFDGNPEASQADWNILYSKLGGIYSSENKPGLYLQALYEIEERLPQIIQNLQK